MVSSRREGRVCDKLAGLTRGSRWVGQSVRVFNATEKVDELDAVEAE